MNESSVAPPYSTVGTTTSRIPATRREAFDMRDSFRRRRRYFFFGRGVGVGFFFFGCAADFFLGRGVGVGFATGVFVCRGVGESSGNGVRANGTASNGMRM